MGSAKLRNIRNYLLRQARYLDVARWNFHFEDGAAAAVLKALKAYQNDDGGFGRGLEPDSQNPHSSPLTTWSATRILREVGFPDLAWQMIRGILGYLEATPDFRGGKWTAATASNNDHPHAPWWHWSADTDLFQYNPSAELAGFVLRFAEPASVVYGRAESLVRTLMPEVMSPAYALGTHELSNLLMLFEDLTVASRSDLILPGFDSFLHEKVKASILQDPAAYRPDEYVTSPMFFIMSADSPYYAENKAICDFFAGYLEDTVKPEGYWALNWTWGEEPVPENVQRDWHGVQIVNHMLYLQGMKPER
ncbi:MAG TPA: hypothetical protein GXZ64_09775 [Clostridiaceae bacterium]|nr:hypothetical protein [Clostridiaceae bacterium]